MYENLVDAFQLVIKLGLRVECNLNGQAYVWKDDKLLWNEFALNAHNDDERLAAIIRAITHAAQIMEKDIE